MTDLIPIEEVNAPALFIEGGLDDLLTRIQVDALSVVYDVDTVAGRADIASLAYKVARSKTAIDDAGKALVVPMKQQINEIDEARKHARDFLDALKGEVRQPLTVWEMEENAKKKREEEAALIELCHMEGLELDALFDREAVVKAKEAKIAAAEAKRAQKARDKEIAANATAKAEAAAAEKIQRAEAIAASAEADAEARAKLRAEYEERERKRIEKVQEEENRKRRENLEHQREVNKAAFLELSKRLQQDFSDWKKDKTDSYGPEDVARAVVIMVAKGEIPGMEMEY